MNKPQLWQATFSLGARQKPVRLVADTQAEALKRCESLLLAFQQGWHGDGFWVLDEVAWMNPDWAKAKATEDARHGTPDPELCQLLAYREEYRFCRILKLGSAAKLDPEEDRMTLPF